MYRIKVKKIYRPLIKSVTKEGYVQTFKGRPKMFRSRSEATRAKMYIVTSAFPRAKSKQSVAYSFFKVVKK